MKRLLLILLYVLLVTVPIHAQQPHPAPAREMATDQKIETVERTLVGLPTEHTVFFDPFGNVIPPVFGGGADDSRIPIICRPGYIETHNHTLNITLSTADVNNAAHMCLHQVRVVEPNAVTCSITTSFGHPLVEMTLDDSYDRYAYIAPSGAYDYNYDAVWQHYAAVNGLRYGCSHL